jgi:hypothetical protein
MSVIREQGLALLMSIIGILILLLALLILFHENMNATKGYRLRTLEQERTQLLLKEEVQNMQIAELQSLTYLQDDPQIQGMIPLTKPQYITEQQMHPSGAPSSASSVPSL